MVPQRRSKALAVARRVPAAMGRPGELPGRQPENATTRGRPRIWIGPAGWSYPDWRGIVYPPYPHGSGRELETVAGIFDVVEINTSFYRPPRPELTRVWLRKTAANPHFRFTAKLYRRFTHERDASASEERQFKDGIAPLLEAGKLGALLMQFPWSFKNAPENRQYLAGLLLRFHGYPLAVEIRHASWNTPEVLNLLAEHGSGFCNLDQPVIGRSLAPTDNATASLGYVRLHGRNYDSWFAASGGVDLRYDYLYSVEELAEWEQRIASVAARCTDTYVILNNHYQGKAVANAIQLRSRIEGKLFPVPQQLRERYPQLEPFCAPPVFEETLFPLR